MTAPRKTVPLLVLCALALAAPPTASAAAGDVIVRYAPGTDAGERAEVRADADVRRVETLALPRTEVVAPEAGTTVAEAVAELSDAGEVVSAEPDAPRSAFKSTNDSRFYRQWSLLNIDATTAWDKATDASDVTVGIVDSGVDLDHPDLVDNIVQGGLDFIANDTEPQDGDGHGTHVAGTVGAEGDNGFGVSGVAWDASLLPMRVLDDSGNGPVSAEISGIAAAIAGGAQVVNLSLGGDKAVSAERALMAAASDVLFVVAAGNDAADNDATPSYPCAYDLPNILCVASTDSADAVAATSNYGATTVDLAAPGEAVYSTMLGGFYGWMSGTSMATPHVSGAAALVLAQRPELTVAELRQVLMTSTDPVAGLSGKTVSGGRLDVAAALAEPVSDVRTPATVVGTIPTITSTPATTAAPATTTPSTTAGGGSAAARTDRTAPSVSFSLTARGALRSALAGRLRTRAGCSERCTVTVDLVADARTARALGLGRSATRIGGASATLARAGQVSVALRLTRAAKTALRTRRSVKVTVRATAADVAGNRRTRSRSITLRR